jgi:Cd2+/Zn2+-exporting ATPase
VFLVDGLDCSTEAALIEQRIGGLAGVCSLRASPLSGQAVVTHTLGPGELERAFREAGFRVQEARRVAPAPVPAVATLAAMALTAAGFFAGFSSPRLAVALYLPAIVVGGWPIARKGWRRARQGALDMNALMAVAVVGAMAIGEWGEGATTVVLFSLAQLMEARSLERARRAIGSLMAQAPDTARVITAAGEEERPVAEVGAGDRIAVRPGERFPLDGLVVSGQSAVDLSPLTGESRPVPRGAGDEVFAGGINGGGALAVRVTRASGETTLDRIVRRVEQAQSSRAVSQGFVDAFARVYTPAVMALAALAAVLPPLLGLGGFTEWSYRALVLLVIACPCALVISTPVSIVSALTAASRAGVLVKGGAHLEALAGVRAVVFDKTGTLTRGVPVVTDVLAGTASAADVLALAAALERHSAHPIAGAVLERAREAGLTVSAAEDVQEIAGRGLTGRVGGAEVALGSHRLFHELGLCDHRLDADMARLEAEGKTVVLVGRMDAGGSGLAGALAVADDLRPEAAEAVAELRAAGLAVAMLTGDNVRTAEAVAARVGIEAPQSELLPDDKVARVEELQARRGPVAMVGDGFNDAPALAAAAVGVAIGGRASDVALETADVALMSGDLRRIPMAVRLGRAARRAVRVNIGVSLAVKAAVLVLALLGYGSLWAAVAADMGASLLVIGNGMRLLRAAR